MPVDFVFEDHLKRQFRKFSRAAHPDKNKGSDAVFKELGKAVETLEDPKARILYDTGFDLDNAETQAVGTRLQNRSNLRSRSGISLSALDFSLSRTRTITS